MASSTQIAIVDSTLLATYAVGQLSLSWIVQNCGGRKMTLVGSFLLSGVTTFAFGFLNSPTLMALMWGLAGIFAAPASPLFAIIVGESVPDSVRGTVMGIWSSCENLGGVFANNVPTQIAKAVGPSGDDAWRCAATAWLSYLQFRERISHWPLGHSSKRAAPPCWPAAPTLSHPQLVACHLTAALPPSRSWIFFMSGPLVAMWAPMLLLTLTSDTASKPASTPSKADGATALKAAAAPSPLSIPGVGACSACYTLIKSARYCLMFCLPTFLSEALKMDRYAAASFSSLLDL